MWYLWIPIILVMICSTSQFFALIACFFKWPEMLVGMPTKNKIITTCTFILHLTINVTWIVLVCTVPIISRYYIAIIVVASILLILIFASLNDTLGLYYSFRKLTGADVREEKKSREEIIEILRVSNSDNKTKAIQTNSQISNKDSIAQLDVNDKFDDDEIFMDWSEFDDDDDDFDDNDFDEVDSITDKKNKNTSNDSRAQKNEITEQDVILSVNKKYQLERMFRQYFDDSVIVQECQINDKQCIVYYFSDTLKDYLPIGKFLYLAEVGDKNPRYFALEFSFGSVYMLCEWKFENGFHTEHVNYGEIIVDKYNLTDITTVYNEFIDKIKHILNENH